MQKQNQLKKTDENEPYHYSSKTTSYSDGNGLTQTERKIMTVHMEPRSLKQEKNVIRVSLEVEKLIFKEELKKKKQGTT
jgi:hypothetical protein